MENEFDLVGVERRLGGGEEAMVGVSKESRSMGLPQLPMDVIAQILSRLPVKTLLQYRCVSKSWLSLISSTHFAKTHLNQSLTNPKIDTHLALLYRRSPGHTLYTINLETHPNTMVEKDVDFIFGDQYPHQRVGAVGSCNGLVCIVSELGYSYISNIATREIKKLPTIGITHSRGSYNYQDDMFGFAYDHTVDDYKVVRGDRYNYSMYVYSLRSDSWKVVQSFPYSEEGFTLPWFESGKVVNNAMHWICPNKFDHRSIMIAAFDLVLERFREVPKPDAPCCYGNLAVLGGWLCVIDGHEMWVMKEYGAKHSWTKIEIHFPDDVDLFPLLMKDEQILFSTSLKKLVLYNMRERTHRKLRFQELQHGHMLILQQEVFVESLVSPSLKCEPGPELLTDEVSMNDP